MEFNFQHIHTNACFCFPENITSLQMCRVHGIHNMCFFAKLGIVIGGFSSKQKSPNSGIGCIFANYSKKHPILVLFFRKMYTDGWVIWRKIGIEKVKFSSFGSHIHGPFWQKQPTWGCAFTLTPVERQSFHLTFSYKIRW